MAATLSAAKMQTALERVRAWSADPFSPVACPICEAAGLMIEDRSARPHTEWYRLHCQACGLDQSIAIPMAPPHT